jgi:L-2-hydroxycarboxylate dehydrogenase (NAD+)
MATSTVPAGKIEVALRENTGIPLGWLNDKDGKPTEQPVWMLQGGTLTPLGNDREHGGHKGYGLSLMVDILSAILSGANYGAKQEGLIRAGAGTEPSNVGHFFMALLIEGFRPLAEFKRTMDDALRALKDSAKTEGHERIYVAGEPEFMDTEESRKKGVPLSNVVVTTVTNLGNETGVPFDLA